MAFTPPTDLSVWAPAIWIDRQFKVGVLCYRENAGGAEVLIVTSRRKKTLWTLPKGTVEDKETYLSAAHRELAEEAGMCANLRYYLGATANTKNPSKPIEWFAMEATHAAQEWLEKDCRKAEWCSIEEAIQRTKDTRPENVELISRFLRIRANG
jgi:8-oxo-dGTP pyrophosphatase MutT (NUDIX family)